MNISMPNSPASIDPFLHNTPTYPFVRLDGFRSSSEAVGQKIHQRERVRDTSTCVGEQPSFFPPHR